VITFPFFLIESQAVLFPFVIALCAFYASHFQTRSPALIPAPNGGFLSDVPVSSIVVGTPGCANYNPAAVNWNNVQTALLTYFANQPGTIAPGMLAAALPGIHPKTS
jgi:hypothetical protein